MDASAPMMDASAPIAAASVLTPARMPTPHIPRLQLPFTVVGLTAAAVRRQYANLGGSPAPDSDEEDSLSEVCASSALEHAQEGGGSGGGVGACALADAGAEEEEKGGDAVGRPGRGNSSSLRTISNASSVAVTTHHAAEEQEAAAAANEAAAAAGAGGGGQRRSGNPAASSAAPPAVSSAALPAASSAAPPAAHPTKRPSLWQRMRGLAKSYMQPQDDPFLVKILLEWRDDVKRSLEAQLESVRLHTARMAEMEAAGTLPPSPSGRRSARGTPRGSGRRSKM